MRRDLRWWFQRLTVSYTGTVGAIIVLAVLFVAIFAPYISPHDPWLANLGARFAPPFWSQNAVPGYLLGTDQLGRDVLSRILYGTRVSLIVGLAASAISAVVGVTLGLVAGYYGGWLEDVFMRITDALAAFPKIALYLVVMTMFGAGFVILILTLGLVRWSSFARLVRGEVLSVKQKEYVEAAHAIGQNATRIMGRHIVPNVFASIIVLGTLEIAAVIIAEASLSFLGVGVPPPAISWGRMLSDGRDYLASAYWIATFPGIAITMTVLGVFMLGDWLRDVLDPRLKQ